MKSEHDFDAIVIGSGFGGSVMTYRAGRGRYTCLSFGTRKDISSQFLPPRTKGSRAEFLGSKQGLYGMFNIWSFKGSGAVVSSG